MEEETVFYVGIEGPTELRKDILNCSKGVIGTLKDYENFKELRTEKDKAIIELKKVISEIIFLNEKLMEHFPRAKVRAMDKEKKEQVKQRSKRIGTQRKRIAEAREMEMDSLEAELNDIESKIKAFQ